MIAKAIVITMVPPTIHGRRRPKREVVRSDNRPNSTLPMTANSAPTLNTRPVADVFCSSGTIVWTFTAMPMIAGPSSATKKTNWAKTRTPTYFGPTSLVGSVNQWCSCGSWTLTPASRSSVLIEPSFSAEPLSLLNSDAPVARYETGMSEYGGLRAQGEAGIEPTLTKQFGGDNDKTGCVQGADIRAGFRCSHTPGGDRPSLQAGTVDIGDDQLVVAFDDGADMVGYDG